VLLGTGNLSPPLNAAPASSDNPPTQYSGASLSEKELEELVAPVALYPDELLGVVLAASTYPLQIVQATRFLEKHKRDSNLQPDESWDTSVLALVNYPEVIDKMNQDLDWTSRLGDAVLNQEADVMDAIQRFREQVDSVGNLESNDKVVIIKEKEIIRIESADPEVIYVPSYQPSAVVVAYAAPASLYYYSSPYPYYYSPGAVFFTGLFVGAAIGYGLSWGRRGYHRGSINVNVNRNVNINRRNVSTRNINRKGKGVTSSSWKSRKRTGGGRGGARPVDRSARKSGQRAGTRVGDRPRTSAKGKGTARPSTRPATKTAKRTDRARTSAKTGTKTARRSEPSRTRSKTAAKTTRRSGTTKSSSRATKGNFGGYKSGRNTSRHSSRGATSRRSQRSSGSRSGGGRSGGGRGGRGGGGGRR
jgi:hypothetical protein